MTPEEKLRQHVDDTLYRLEISAKEMSEHNCAQHPTITHERWLECHRECLATLAGTPDPEFEANKRAHEAERERMRRQYERR